MSSVPEPQGLPLHDPVPSQLPTQGLVEMLRYYRATAGARPLPARADIDPRRIPRGALPFVFIAATDDGSADALRYRLVGTGLTQKMGRDTTGMLLCDAYIGPDWNALRPLYHHVLTAATPVLARADFVGTDDRVYHYYRLLMPLSEDGARVDMCLGYVEFND